jgi:hypothetical protein
MMPVGFFTKGINYSLPHPLIDDRVILLICAALARSWTLLIHDPPRGFDIDKADEDTITEQLVGIIESRLRKNGEVSGFDRALFGKVVREPKVTNYSKSRPDKMPDILFDLRREQLPVLSEQDGLFVECKPVDAKHPVYSCYCKKGLVRFVNGDYAWAMRQALMVGYAADTYDYLRLSSVLADRLKNAPFNVVAHGSCKESGLYRSTHKREFPWLEKHGTASPICVSHLWLPMPVGARV